MKGFATALDYVLVTSKTKILHLFSSMGAAGFLIAIMGIAIFKYILFGALFILSGGKLNFWLFPNLTEDVGFFESFMPL